MVAGLEDVHERVNCRWVPAWLEIFIEKWYCNTVAMGQKYSM